MTRLPKLAILQSLDGLDQAQMERLLVFIKDVLLQEEKTPSISVKNRAMMEIRQALLLQRQSPIRA